MTHNATSYSELNTYGRCAYQHYLKSSVRIQRKRRNVNLKQGTMIHEGLKTAFLALQAGKDFNYAFWSMRQYFDGLLSEVNDRQLFEENKAEEMELIEDSFRIVEAYLLRNKDTILSWEILHVEEEFLYVHDGEVITFTPDLIIRDKNGFVWIIDHKSTSRVPGYELPFSDLQTLLYFAGVREMYPELRGFVFNYLRKKVPTVPRLNKTHNKESKLFGEYFVNDIKHIDTTYELLRDFLLVTAPNLLGEVTHQQRLAELRDRNRFFWTEEIVVNDAQVEEILQQVHSTLAQMQWSRDTGIYPKTILNDLAGVQSCQNCEFSRICHTQLLGWNTELVLEEEYEPRDPKNQYEEIDDD
jgi:hypothetical protein